MRISRPLLVLTLILCVAEPSSARAQSDKLPEVRRLTQADATILLGMNGSPSIRVTSAGRILAADFFNRRFVIVDPDLTKVETLFDATTPPPLTFPAGFALLSPAAADTTLFYDSGARGFRVLDPEGRVVRRMGIADPNLQRPLQNPASGATMDAGGHIIFVAQRSSFDRPIPGVQPQSDSLVVARITMGRQGWDSLGALMGSGQRIAQVGDTSVRPRAVVFTLPVVDRGDAWAVLEDGTVAIVRSGDFHVDWIAPDGSRHGTAPVPWSWRKYTPAERDSLRAALEAVYASGTTRVMSSAGTTNAALPSVARVIDTVPERVPAIASSTARVDLDGRIWLELGPRLMGPRSPVPVVYAVLDRNGRMVDRVELPARRVLAGFGPGGSVYAIAAPTTRDGFALERYRYSKR